MQHNCLLALQQAAFQAQLAAANAGGRPPMGMPGPGPMPMPMPMRPPPMAPPPGMPMGRPPMGGPPPGFRPGGHALAFPGCMT